MAASPKRAADDRGRSRLYCIIFTSLPHEWMHEHGVVKGVVLVCVLGAPVMFAMGGWFCVPLVLLTSGAFRFAGTRGWGSLLALAVLVGAGAGLLLGYLPILQLIWLEDQSPAALALWQTHGFALDRAIEGWGFLAPPCLALSITLGALYGLASKVGRGVSDRPA